MEGNGPNRCVAWLKELPVPALIVGNDGMLTCWNVAFSSSFPKWAGQINERMMLRDFPAKMSPALQALLELAVSTGRDQELCFDADESRAEGGLKITVRPLHRLDEQLEGVVVFFTGSLVPDTIGTMSYSVVPRSTEESPVRPSGDRRSTAASLALRAAESQFLANLTHELRMPLNGIIGTADLLLETSLNRSQIEYLRMILDSSESLLMIINDVLDYAKIETGQFRLDPKAIDVAEVVGDAVRSLAFRAHTKGLELVFRVEPASNLRVNADPLRIRQIILNLLENAIKFTDEGEVLVELSSVCGTSDVNWIECSVCDTGVGIPTDELKRLNTQFLNAGDKQTEGLGYGLGLMICARLIQRMGGEITAKSVLGEGSWFTFRLPLDLAQGWGEVEGTSQGSVQGLRLMVIEEHSTGRRILRDMLASWGLSVTVCTGKHDVESQLEAAARSQMPFDVIIVDHNLLSPDGVPWPESLVRDWEIRPESILVLTTGRLTSEAFSLSDLGIDPPLLKPPKQSELFQAILNRAASHRVTVTSEWESSGEQFLAERPRWRILVAEDNKVNQKLAEGILGKMGHDVKLASDGAEALQCLETERFDLIFMDRQMPELDGVQAARIFRHRATSDDVYTPIVAMISHATPEDRRQCVEAGIDDHVSKPLRSKELNRKFNELMQRFPHLQNVRSRGTKGTEQEAQSTSPDGAIVPLAMSPDQTGEVDWARALHHSAGDDELLLDLLQTFLDDLPRLLDRIERALGSQDRREVSAAAHSLKGSLGFLNTRTAHDACERIELQSAMWSEAELQLSWADCKTKVLNVRQEVSQRLRQDSRGLS